MTLLCNRCIYKKECPCCGKQMNTHDLAWASTLFSFLEKIYKIPTTELLDQYNGMVCYMHEVVCKEGNVKGGNVGEEFEKK